MLKAVISTPQVGKLKQKARKIGKPTIFLKYADFYLN